METQALLRKPVPSHCFHSGRENLCSSPGGNPHPGRIPWSPPHKILEALDGGNLPILRSKDPSGWSESANGSSQIDALSLESMSKEAYFSRVETFTISFPALSLQGGSCPAVSSRAPSS
uniref:Uncharacterized protein n=1 Tax=Apteryx owenii TaxID=8824 RepID=A0A8B9Q3Z5_APTOW